MKGRSLQAQLGFRILLVAICALGVMVILLGILTHGHMHRQTDALLLHLAHAEAASMIEEDAGFHVHDMSVHLPGITGGLSRRYAMVFEKSGRVLDHTENLRATRIPEEWNSALNRQTPWFANTDLFSQNLLRFVMIPMEMRGQQVYISVGVAHADLDASLWSFIYMAVPGALIAAAMIGLAGVWLTRRRIVDLTRLGAACRQLELFSGDFSSQRDRNALTVPEDAAEEIRVLAGTLRELIDRVQSLLETQNRFVAEAAHELRTPLTSLQGDLELALRRPRTVEEYREFIQEAMTDVNRLKTLTFDLLEGARGREGGLKLEPTSLLELLEKSIQGRAKLLSQAGLKLELEVPDTLWVNANPSAGIRVIENLLDNSIRHSQATTLLFRARLAQGKVELLVADNGVGIQSGLAERLFHPFQKGGRQGFGLGLYIAHQLMRAQNGDIKISDAPGSAKVGACWVLTFEVGTIMSLNNLGHASINQNRTP